MTTFVVYIFILVLVTVLKTNELAKNAQDGGAFAFAALHVTASIENNYF